MSLQAIKKARNRNKPSYIYNLKGKSRFVLLCDHASNKIPKKYNNLGLPLNEIKRHIGWDIGAAKVAKKIASRLDSVLVMSGYSRLIIDCNRPLSVYEAFIKKSENTVIPGNLYITKKEKTERYKKYCLPYRKKIDKIINLRIKNNIVPIIISIHSFTPIYKGRSRPWHLGILYRKDKRLANLIHKIIKKNKSIKVGINEPYKCDLKGDFSIPYFAEQNGLPNILFEIRQDLINDSKGVEIWSNRLFKLLISVINEPKIKFSLRPPRDIPIYYKKRNRI